jgi:hypothetical protein
MTYVLTPGRISAGRHWHQPGMAETHRCHLNPIVSDLDAHLHLHLVICHDEDGPVDLDRAVRECHRGIRETERDERYSRLELVGVGHRYGLFRNITA